ncbi:MULTISPECIES: hypothetical protein [Streptosporangium]|uniref:Uncharacterized protein n=1 Tax=Streptosporangium brasiliense TaxID=47480 RepID=A0ABT9R6U5_9ACTN|nr:hypothetical protein [Streptosporangium brasiliense]MDP9864863.1 hypothetical protein [Streptosporangium brasiliense]
MLSPACTARTADWMQLDRLARAQDANGELTDSEREEVIQLRRQRAEGHWTQL